VQVVHDIFPRLVVWIGQAIAGRIGRKESMKGGDVVVAESWERGNHCGLVEGRKGGGRRKEEEGRR